MKKILLSALSLFISTIVISQSCLPEGIEFTTQEQIDNFQTDYPGCIEIEGDVTIIGYEISNFKIGGEFNYRINDDNVENHNKWGYSFYSMYNFAKKWEIFVRYDILTSSRLGGEDYGWNYAKDGSALIAGIQYRPIRYVNIALNYRDWYPYPQNLPNEAYIFLSLEFKL